MELWYANCPTQNCTRGCVCALSGFMYSLQSKCVIVLIQICHHTTFVQLSPPHSSTACVFSLSLSHSKWFVPAHLAAACFCPLVPSLPLSQSSCPAITRLQKYGSGSYPPPLSRSCFISFFLFLSTRLLSEAWGTEGQRGKKQGARTREVMKDQEIWNWESERWGETGTELPHTKTRKREKEEIKGRRRDG